MNRPNFCQNSKINTINDFKINTKVWVLFLFSMATTISLKYCEIQGRFGTFKTSFSDLSVLNRSKESFGTNEGDKWPYFNILSRS